MNRPTSRAGSNARSGSRRLRFSSWASSSPASVWSSSARCSAVSRWPRMIRPSRSRRSVATRPARSARTAPRPHGGWTGRSWAGPLRSGCRRCSPWESAGSPIRTSASTPARPCSSRRTHRAHRRRPPRDHRPWTGPRTTGTARARPPRRGPSRRAGHLSSSGATSRCRAAAAARRPHRGSRSSRSSSSSPSSGATAVMLASFNHLVGHARSGRRHLAGRVPAERRHGGGASGALATARRARRLCATLSGWATPDGLTVNGRPVPAQVFADAGPIRPAVSRGRAPSSRGRSRSDPRRWPQSAHTSATRWNQL